MSQIMLESSVKKKIEFFLHNIKAQAMTKITNSNANCLVKFKENYKIKKSLSEYNIKIKAIKNKINKHIKEDYIKSKYNKFNRVTIFNNKIKQELTEELKNNTVMILENFREEIPNEWSNAIKWFIKNLKSDNYKFTVNIVPWVTNVLDSILETELDDYRLIDDVYDKYDGLWDKNIIKIQRWFRRIKFTKKLWPLIEEVVKIYYHPNSNYLQRVIKDFSYE